MDEKNKSHRNYKIATYLCIALVVVVSLLFHELEIIQLNVGHIIILFGILFATSGIFGLLNNEISLRNAKGLKYSENSVLGKSVNAILITLGIIFVLIGIINVIVN